MNPLDNRYERNPTLFRDMPQDLFTDQGNLAVMLHSKDDSVYPCLLHFETDFLDFTVDCSAVKNVWEDGFRDDIYTAIETRFNRFFLSRKDLNLNIIGL